MGVEEGRGKKEYASSVSREREREREREELGDDGGGGGRGDVVVQVRGESDEVKEAVVAFTIVQSSLL